MPRRTARNKSARYKGRTREPYDWVVNVRDAEQRPSDHDEYDPHTIYIPQAAWKGFTPTETRYWRFKRNLWKTILIIEGYQLYYLMGQDVHIASQYFDKTIQHDGDPMYMLGHQEAKNLEKKLLQGGHRVAWVEKDNSQDPEASVYRLTRISTPGTAHEPSTQSGIQTNYCLSIKEQVISGKHRFGAVLMDSVTANFFFTAFTDDDRLTTLRTVLAQTNPVDIVMPRSISRDFRRVLKTDCSRMALWTKDDFWTADHTRCKIDQRDYFGNQGWPKVLKELNQEDITMSAFGGLILYLTHLQRDREFISSGEFSWYLPLRNSSNLILSHGSLSNLDIFGNSDDGENQGTLFHYLDHCTTAPGRRLLKQWVSCPSSNLERLNKRFDALDQILDDEEGLKMVTRNLKTIPDLEKSLFEVRAGKCRPENLIRFLQGLRRAIKTVQTAEELGWNNGINSELLDSMPDVETILEHWELNLDYKETMNANLIKFRPHFNTEFDELQLRMKPISTEIETLLCKISNKTGAKRLSLDKKEHQQYYLFVRGLGASKIPRDWRRVFTKGTGERYIVPELCELRENHAKILEEQIDLSGKHATQISAQLSNGHGKCVTLIRIIAQLDCLRSLAKASSAIGEPRCRPTFIESESSLLEFQDLRHPPMIPGRTEYMPSDVKLGGKEAKISILTGPNSAGKSTTMRATCLAVIMAQIGCYVPCRFARISPVDRILTRAGATDSLMQSRSTFHNELLEVKEIIDLATPRSLAIIDELGRGTSSIDGYSIASAVLHHLATYVGCMGFFTTHFLALSEDFAVYPEISLKRMTFLYEISLKRMTFLYTMEEGIVKGSYGFNCAAEAGIPGDIIDRARSKAEEIKKLKSAKADQNGAIPLGLWSELSACLDSNISSAGLALLKSAAN